LIVTDATKLSVCVRDLARSPVIGFDTEFVGEDSYQPELCLIQISTAERLYIIDPFACGPLDSFWALLHDPERVVLVHAAREEVRLCRFGSGKVPANLFDMQIAVGFMGLTYPISYAGLVQEILGVRLTKGDTLSDWRRRPLSDSQLRYAFDDVRYLIPAYEIVSAKLNKLKRLEWAAEDFAAFIKRAIGGDDGTVERWRKIKGIGGLNRRELAVIRAVFWWRERVAERWNRPARTVLRDDLLVEIARRGARSPDDLEELRGLPKKEIEPIQEAVRKAAKLPLAECPAEIEPDYDPPQVATLGALLNVVLTDTCARMKLAPSLVCSSQDLKDLVRARQPGISLPEDSPFIGGWRREAVLPVLDSLLDGKLQVRVSNPSAVDPLEFVEG
jgi:ribonuclease D